MLIFKFLINAVRISNGKTPLCFIAFQVFGIFYDVFRCFSGFIHLFATFFDVLRFCLTFILLANCYSMFQLVFDPVFTKVLLFFAKCFSSSEAQLFQFFISQSLRVACLSCHSTTTTTSTQIFKFCKG